MSRSTVFSFMAGRTGWAYDVMADGRDAFVRKAWLPVNSAIRDPDGRTIGILHHVEDVTHLLATTALERDVLASHDAPLRSGTPAWADALRHDSLQRRTHATSLLRQSRQALERMSRRIDAGQDGPDPD